MPPTWVTLCRFLIEELNADVCQPATAQDPTETPLSVALLHHPLSAALIEVFVTAAGRNPTARSLLFSIQLHVAALMHDVPRVMTLLSQIRQTNAGNPSDGTTGLPSTRRCFSKFDDVDVVNRIIHKRCVLEIAVVTHASLELAECLIRHGGAKDVTTTRGIILMDSCRTFPVMLRLLDDSMPFELRLFRFLRDQKLTDALELLEDAPTTAGVDWAFVRIGPGDRRFTLWTVLQDAATWFISSREMTVA